MMLAQRLTNVMSWNAAAVGTTSAALDAASATRRALQLTNTSPSQTIYLGYGPSVSASFYLKRLAPGEFFEIVAGPQVPLHAIASAPGATLSVAEVA